MIPLTAAEERLLNHVGMFGSDGYPIRRYGSSWSWGTDGVKGPPTTFKTKRAAVESFERFLDVLMERNRWHTCPRCRWCDLHGSEERPVVPVRDFHRTGTEHDVQDYHRHRDCFEVVEVKGIRYQVVQFDTPDDHEDGGLSHLAQHLREQKVKRDLVVHRINGTVMHLLREREDGGLYYVTRI